MHILFIFPYPLDESPSQRFRFEQYLGLLTSRGFKYRTMNFWIPRAWRVLYKPGHAFEKILGMIIGFVRRGQILFYAPRYDIIFIHREILPVGPPIVEWIVAKIFRKKIIYDFDDAIWLQNTSTENKIVSIVKWPQKVGLICRWSYRVSVGNEYLKSFASTFNKNVVINPTTLDTQGLHNPLLYNKRKNKKITIGWTGTHSTLKYLDLILPVIEKLEITFPDQIRFLVIADQNPAFQLSSFEFITWSKEKEVQDMMQIDIGIMPLPSDQWTLGKCGFKTLQYMSLEIPSISSPVGVNNVIVNDGLNGFLCDTLFEWEQKIYQLIGDEALRARIGKEGRKTVLENYSVSSNSDNFLSLFE